MNEASRGAVTPGRVLRVWWPLATSWLLMGAEGPVVTAFLARSADSEVQLAAFSAAFNVALVVEAPIIMLLAASTALAVDRAAYRRLERYMWTAALALTALHALVAFTPLFDVLAITLLELPPPVQEPTRLGLQWLLPWTGSIAYRRFQQGVLIRTEHAGRVLVGTMLRLSVGVATITTGFALGLEGIRLGALTLSAGVVAEALFAWLAVRGPRAALPERDESNSPISLGSFLAFYLPLAATPLLILGVQPFGTATMTRMPMPLESLAAYHGVHSLVFLTRSVGFAFNEVVVALLGRPGAVASLLTFARRLALGAGGVMAALALTPLGDVWFGRVQAFPPHVAMLAAAATFFAVLMPVNQVLQSWFGGVLVKARRTRGVTESVAIYALFAIALLWLGIRFQPAIGLVWTVGSLTAAGLAQAGWLALRSRKHVAAFRDAETTPTVPLRPRGAIISELTSGPRSPR
ncbi:MAG: hypothetical protein WD226_07435 [Planctomycetota bacterium]